MATKAPADLSVFGKGQHETIKLNEIKKKIKKKQRDEKTESRTKHVGF